MFGDWPSDEATTDVSLLVRLLRQECPYTKALGGGTPLEEESLFTSPLGETADEDRAEPVPSCS